MSERLKLTSDEIERLLDELGTEPPTPEVITVRPDEISDQPSRRSENSRGILRVTDADLERVQPLAQSTPDLALLETLMFGLVNSARQEHLPRWLGNANLRWHDQLAAVARGHSADMLKRGYVSHITPEGVKVAQRINGSSIRYLACGENIGVVYGPHSHNDQGVYDVHKAFMNQPRRLTNHRGNLLNPIWTHVGVGAAYDPSGSLFLTQNFISTLGT